MTAFIVFSIRIVGVLCTISVAPVAVNLLGVFQRRFHPSAVRSGAGTFVRLWGSA